MKTFEDFLDKYRNDDAFFTEFSSLVKEEKNAGAATVFEAASKVAAKLGYEVSEDQIKDAINSGNKITDEDLGKASGGVVCACGYKDGRVNRGCQA